MSALTPSTARSSCEASSSSFTNISSARQLQDQKCAPKPILSASCSTHKKGVNRDSTDHGRMGQAQSCPAVVLSRLATYIRHHSVTRTTPLAMVRHKDKWTQIRSNKITSAIRTIIRAEGPTIYFTPEDVITRFPRACGTMVLLTELVDPDTILIVGRWWSDTIIRCLHTTSKSFTDGLAVRMFQYDDYALIFSAHAAV